MRGSTQQLSNWLVRPAVDDVTAGQIFVALQCSVWLLAEMPLSRAVFGLNNRKSGVNRQLLISTMSPTHCTFPSFFLIYITKGAYSLQIYDYLRQIQLETKAFLLIEKEIFFIQIKNIWYYNVYIHNLKLSIKYFNLNITVTSHAEKVSVFTRQISETRLSLLW